MQAGRRNGGSKLQHESQPLRNVTIFYNMSIHHGGLWDPDKKWMWFS